MKTLPFLLSLVLSCGWLSAEQGSKAQSKARGGVKISPNKATFLGVYATKLSPVVSRQLGFSGNLYLSVEQVSPGSPAEKAGLEQYDVLKKLDDQILVNQEQLLHLVRSREANQQVSLTILRGGKEKILKAKLGSKQVSKVQARGSSAPRILGNGLRVGGFTMPDARDLNERIRRQIAEQRDLFGRRGFHGFAPNLDFSDPKLLEKFDVDGDGKLSPMERDKARDEGAVPELDLNFDIDLDFGTVPNVNEILRDARRRGASSSWSSVTGTAQTKVVSVDDEGSFEYSSEDEKKRFKATSPDGEVLFDGPVNTDAERAALPEGMLKRLESLEGNVNIRIHQGGKRAIKRKPGQKKNNKLL
jgi:hypothetical protein